MQDRGISCLALLGATLLYGLPGLVGLFCGGLLVLADSGSETSNYSEQFIEATRWIGVSSLCLGALLILIPVVVGFFALRRKGDLPSQHWDEPIPPAI